MSRRHCFSLAVLLVCSVASGAVERFAHTDFNRPDFFPILPWDPFHGWDGKARDSDTNGLQSIAACHFNFAGFVQPEDVKKCGETGLAAILLPSGHGVLPLKYQAEWRHLSDAEIERRIRTMVRAGGSSPAL